MNHPARVTFGELERAEQQFKASYGLIVDRGTPIALYNTGWRPAGAGPQDTIASFADRAQRLQPADEQFFRGYAAEAVAFSEQGYAVLVHGGVPYLASSIGPITGEGDLGRLLESPGVQVVGAMWTLPGKPVEIPPARQSCTCPNGHQVDVPPGQPRTCPLHGLPLIC